MSSRMLASNNERHRTERIGWLRAAVLGANDGILSTSSLMLGVAAAHATHGSVLVAGGAGLVAGAMSMAAGEYVSVHSQADTEKADLELERAELKADNKGEHKELAAIYVARGLDPVLAKQVAQQLMVHLRSPSCSPDSSRVGIGWQFCSRWDHASLGHDRASPARTIPLVAGTSLVFLSLLGGLAARAGGAGVMVGALRVTFWGALAIAVTAGVGSLFGTFA